MTGIGDIFVIILLGIGAIFCMLAAVGIVVMPDVYNRMQAASKAVTLGACSIVLGAVIHFADPAVTVRCLLVCVFLFATVPAATHLIARAAYRRGDVLAPETVIDELADANRD